MKGEYNALSARLEKHDLFLDYSVRFIRAFYFDNVCSYLKSTLFLQMYREFDLNVDYSGENLNIINNSHLHHFIKYFK